MMDIWGDHHKKKSIGRPFENMGAKLVSERGYKTNDIAGDSTTTATAVFDSSHRREGIKNVTAGANPIGIRRGIA